MKKSNLLSVSGAPFLQKLKAPGRRSLAAMFAGASGLLVGCTANSPQVVAPAGMALRPPVLAAAEIIRCESENLEILDGDRVIARIRKGETKTIRFPSYRSVLDWKCNGEPEDQSIAPRKFNTIVVKRYPDAPRPTDPRIPWGPERRADVSFWDEAR